MVPQELYDNLENFKDFDVGENTEKFLDTVDKIVTHQDPESVPVLLRYFDDDSDYDWVLQSVTHALESLPDDVYIKEIIRNIHLLLNHAPIWSDNLFNRIFNHKPSLDAFKKNMHFGCKGDLLKLFDIMEKESPHHQELIKELRAKLDQQ